MSAPAPGAATQDVAGAMWRGGALPAAAGMALVVLISTLWGWRAVLGALLGAVLLLLAFRVPTWLMRRSAALSPVAVMALSLAGFAALVLLLGVVLVGLGDAEWFSGVAVAASLIVGAVLFAAGQLRAVSRLRIPVFGPPPEPPPVPPGPSAARGEVDGPPRPQPGGH